MTLGLNREGNKTKICLPKTAYQSKLKGRGRLCHWNSLIRILPLLSQLTVTTEKICGKQNGTERGLKKQKNDNTEFTKKKITKWKSNLKSK